ncbi:MAG: hypothetical protein J2P58_11820 [Acidimicrobiaceae bacterium]|nr:hypothetical protein [Acidimicrobiaceae bacterium]
MVNAFVGSVRPPVRSNRGAGTSLIPYLVGTALVATLFVIITAIYGNPILPTDDAYITVHDAQVLIYHAGHDPNYAGVSPLSGETSLVHLALITLFLPAGGEWASFVVSWLGILAYTLGVVRLTRIFKAGPAVTTLTVAVAVTTGVMGYQLLNGLETGLAMATGVWLLSLALERQHLVWFGLLCGIAPFVRPELGLLSIFLICVVGWPLVRAHEFRDLSGVLIAALLGATPWLLWSGIASGDILPTTLSAKAAWFAEQGLPTSIKRHNLWLAFWNFGRQIGPLMMVAPFLVAFLVGRVAVLFGLIFYGVYFFRYSSELSFYFDRYQYILIPGLLVGLVWLIARSSRLWRGAGFVLASASLVFALATFSGHWSDWTGSRNFTTTQLRPVAQWANAHIPKRSAVMIHDAGYIAFGTDLHLVDVVGLKTPTAVEINKHDITAETDWPGRAKALNRLAQLTHPQYLIVLKGWDYDFGITQAFRSRGWSLRRLRTVVGTDGYDVYAMTVG